MFPQSLVLNLIFMAKLDLVYVFTFFTTSTDTRNEVVMIVNLVYAAFSRILNSCLPKVSVSVTITGSGMP